MKKILMASVVLCGFAGCVPPGQIAEQRCTAAGFGPSDPNAYECYNAEMNRMNAANAALLGASVGLMNAGQPSALPYGAYQLPSNGTHCTYGGGYINCW